MKSKRYPKEFKDQLIKEAQETGNGAALRLAPRPNRLTQASSRWLNAMK